MMIKSIESSTDPPAYSGADSSSKGHLGRAGVAEKLISI